MLVSAVPLDQNWFLQLLLTVFVIAVGLLHLVKNTASKYFEVDANFEAGGGGEPSHRPPMPGVLTDDHAVCANCNNSASKKCSRCKAVRYW
jgi:ubiquitin carboxyl-terminal hydrolase 36/42